MAASPRASRPSQRAVRSIASASPRRPSGSPRRSGGCRRASSRAGTRRRPRGATGTGRRTPSRGSRRRRAVRRSGRSDPSGGRHPTGSTSSRTADPRRRAPRDPDLADDRADVRDGAVERDGLVDVVRLPTSTTSTRACGTGPISASTWSARYPLCAYPPTACSRSSDSSWCSHESGRAVIESPAYANGTASGSAGVSSAPETTWFGVLGRGRSAFRSTRDGGAVATGRSSALAVWGAATTKTPAPTRQAAETMLATRARRVVRDTGTGILRIARRNQSPDLGNRRSD